MTDTVSLCIPRSLIRKAKRHGINCSFVARKAIAADVKKCEKEKAAEVTSAKTSPDGLTSGETDHA